MGDDQVNRAAMLRHGDGDPQLLHLVQDRQALCLDRLAMIVRSGWSTKTVGMEAR